MADRQTIADAALFGITESEITRACERFQRLREHAAPRTSPPKKSAPISIPASPLSLAQLRNLKRLAEQGSGKPKPETELMRIMDGNHDRRPESGATRIQEHAATANTVSGMLGVSEPKRHQAAKPAKQANALKQRFGL